MSTLRRDLRNIKNYFFPTGAIQALPLAAKKTEHNLNNFLAPVRLERLSQSIGKWREWVEQAERYYFPCRVEMQRGFKDTILNLHVAACLERRNDLTLLREFKMSTARDGEENTEWTKYFQAAWATQLTKYALDARDFGYSLISLGDMKDDKFPDITVVVRENIVPHNNDPMQTYVGAFPYSPSGIEFLKDEAVNDWHIWVPTPTTLGISTTGYGLLYNVAAAEIFLRNLQGYNGTFVELFSQPYRVGKTQKTNEEERALMYEALQFMGSNGFAIIDPDDSIEFIETGLGGTGYLGYDNFEARLQKAISKYLLGHADALDSVPGKLGAGDGEDNPVYKALKDKQSKDGAFIEDLYNSVVVPKLRKLGINIPMGLTYFFKNDAEIEEQRKNEDESNMVTAEIAQTMKNGGLKMSAEYFTERTGIPCEEIEEPEPIAPSKGLSEKIKNKLNEIYK